MEAIINTELNFTQWAELMDKVYKSNNNGKWAILFCFMAIYRDFIISKNKLFTTLFLVGGPGTGKTELAKSIRSLFVSRYDSQFNLQSRDDAAFFAVIERLDNHIVIMDEYNDKNISQAKFQGLKSAISDGIGRHIISDINKESITSEIVATPIITGQKIPLLDECSLYSSCIICEIPYNSYTEEEYDKFDILKSYENDALLNIADEILSIRYCFESEFVSMYAEEQVKLTNTVRVRMRKFRTVRVIKSVSNILTICRIIEEKTKLKLPFTYAEFFPIAVEKIVNQMIEIEKYRY
jgi:hypothetical protein